jgi:GT2 family glycosyltransferase
VTPRVSAIVLAFGKEALLDACLRSLRAALARIEAPTELIIVVNRLSAEGRRQLERSTRDQVVVDPGRNLGFAGGVVAGLERARGDWIALVNDDCVVEPGALAAMLEAGEQSDEIGSVAAQVRFAERSDVINSAGIEVDELGVAHERLLGAPVAASEPDVVEVFGASGGAGLFRRRMLEQVGGFDESFFAYLEDADLAWRAQMNSWHCVYAPTAVVMHHHSATLGHRSSEKYFLVGRNRVRMLAKNATRSQLLCRGVRMAAYDLAYVVFVAIRARTLSPLRGRLSGLRDWRSYRAAGELHRRPIWLIPPLGVRGALQRDRAYGA